MEKYAKISSKLKLSLILCTYNPKMDLIARCLAAVSEQTMANEEFEFIIVDNCCNPALQQETLEALVKRDVILEREERAGLAFARVCGFERACADIIVFVDDDNELFPTYLEYAYKIATREPELGVFGGKCHGKLESPISSLKEFCLPFLGVRVPGDEPMTGCGKEWGEHEPIGAGIVVRKPVGELYCKFVNETGAAGDLGRKGSQLLAGEDSLLSRFTYVLGLKNGYRPELELYHFMEAHRLKWSYIVKLFEGHGLSHVRLGRLCGQEFEAMSWIDSVKMRFKNFLYRLKKGGFVHAYAHFFWDRGYFSELRNGRVETHDITALVESQTE